MAQPDELSRFLYRPLVFQPPNRIVEPLSWVEHIPFAFWLVDVLRPAVLVELGTHSGNSYAAFAQAIEATGAATAAYAVDSWKGDRHSGYYDETVFAEWAAYHDSHFSSFSRLVRSTFEAAAGYFADGSVDLLHIDGYHTYEAVAADFTTWRPKLSRRGAILIHDINVRDREFGAWRLWDELRLEYPSFAFLHGHGLGVLAIGADVPDDLQWLCSLRRPEQITEVRQFFASVGGAVLARQLAASSQIDAARAARAVADAIALRQRIDESAASLRARDAELARERDELSRIRTDVSRTEQELAGERSAVARLEAELADSRAEAAAIESRLEREEARRKDSGRLIGELRQRLGTANTRESPTVSRAPTSGLAAAATRRLRPMMRILRAIGLVPGRGSSRWSPVSSLRIAASPRRLKDAYAIARQGLFDEAYYAGTYSDVRRSRLTPLAHFVLSGAREGRNPHPLFDATYYLDHNRDVAAAGLNALVHYQSRGAYEGRKPHPLFDPAYYLAQNPDVRAAGIEPLGHFLRFGVADNRNPNAYFDCAYYLERCPDVASSGANPLIHFDRDGWRERRRPSAAFDVDYYLSENPDVVALDVNPLTHFIEHGASEGRHGLASQSQAATLPAADLPQAELQARSLGPPRDERPTVLCVSHVMPWPPRAGNEYRLYRLLRWLQAQGYRVIPVIAPLPGERVDEAAVRRVADEFGNAVLCSRAGRLDYVLDSAPDVLASLDGQLPRPVSLLLDDDHVRSGHPRQLLEMERTFCHDALITTVLRLNDTLRPSILLLEYIWMTRLLPLVWGDPVVVVDTIDVFSTKQAKVLQFGIDDLHVEPEEEARRLRGADLILAIQEKEGAELSHLVPGRQVVVAGVDFDVVKDGGTPAGQRVLYIASDNPMNRKGLRDFLRFAWPRVRQLAPSAELIVAGRIAGTIHDDPPGVTAVGPVDDLAALYRDARVVINPAVAGTGVKIKTLEALGHLRPIVTWPNGVDGLPADLTGLCVQATDWYEFSQRIAELLVCEQPRLFTAAQREIIDRCLSPAVAYGPMTDALQALVRGRRRRALEQAGLA